jgi:hypothetical protein
LFAFAGGGGQEQGSTDHDLLSNAHLEEPRQEGQEAQKGQEGQEGQEASAGRARGSQSRHGTHAQRERERERERERAWQFSINLCIFGGFFPELLDCRQVFEICGLHANHATVDLSGMRNSKQLAAGLVETRVMCPTDEKDVFLWYFLLKYASFLQLQKT